MKRNPADWLPTAIILGFASIVAGWAFAVSAHGLFDFGQRVMGLPGVLAAGVPIILDAAQLVAIAAAFVNRRSAKHVRFYMWMWVAITVALSMAGNAWDGHVRDLTSAGVYSTMIAPAILALTAHGIVITWRHREPAAVMVPKVAREPSRPKAKATSDEDRKARARALIGKMPYRQIAEQVDLSVRTVARVAKDAKLEPSPNGHDPVGEPA